MSESEASRAEKLSVASSQPRTLPICCCGLMPEVVAMNSYRLLPTVRVAPGRLVPCFLVFCPVRLIRTTKHLPSTTGFRRPFGFASSYLLLRLRCFENIKGKPSLFSSGLSDIQQAHTKPTQTDTLIYSYRTHPRITTSNHIIFSHIIHVQKRLHTISTPSFHA